MQVIRSFAISTSGRRWASAVAGTAAVDLILVYVAPAHSAPFNYHRGGLHCIVAFLGSWVWAKILQNMIDNPGEYLPRRSITLDAVEYEKREALVSFIARCLAGVTILFTALSAISVLRFLNS